MINQAPSPLLSVYRCNYDKKYVRNNSIIV